VLPAIAAPPSGLRAEHGRVAGTNRIKPMQRRSRSDPLPASSDPPWLPRWVKAGARFAGPANRRPLVGNRRPLVTSDRCARASGVRTKNRAVLPG